MKLFNHFFFITIAIIFFSCKKKESDYLGKYSSFYSKEVQVSSSLNSSFSFLSNKKPEVDGKIYYDLCPISLHLFKDESDGKLKGEAEIENIDVHGFTTTPYASKTKMGFDLVNFRMVDDTLEFTFENSLTKMTGKKFKGQIVGEKDQAIIGLSKDLIGKIYTEGPAKPLYKNVSETMMYLNTAHESSKEIKNKFYTSIIDVLKYNKEKSSKEVEKKLYSNGINEIESKIKQLK